MKKSSSIGGIAKRGCFGCLAVFVALFTLGFIVLGILWWRLAVETRAVDDEDTGTVAVAFYFDPSDNKAALRCWVNGIPGDFFIDSGMEAALALQSRFADFSKVPITGKAKVLAYQTFEECRLGEVAQLAVGESDQFLQLEQTRQNTEIGNWDYLPEFEGLLGAKILTRHRAKIDFGSSRITFHQKDQGSSSGQAGPASDERPLAQRPGQISVPFALGSTGSVMVEVTIGDATGLFLVDTGAEYCMISPGFRSRTGLPSGRAVKGLSNNIPTSAELIEADAVSFGSSARATGSVSMIVSSLDALSSHVRGSGGREIDGILGANLLTEYEAVIDYRSQTLTLSASPRGSWKTAWASLKWLAFKYAGMILHEKLGYMRLQEHEADGVSLEVLSIEPPSPVVLQPGEKVKIKFRYTCPNVAEAMIHVLGTFQRKDVPVRRFYGKSPISAQGETVEQEITLNESGQLDELRILLLKVLHQTSKEGGASYKTQLIFERVLPVRLEWKNSAD